MGFFPQPCSGQPAASAVSHSVMSNTTETAGGPLMPVGGGAGLPTQSPRNNRGPGSARRWPAGVHMARRAWSSTQSSINSRVLPYAVQFFLWSAPPPVSRTRDRPRGMYRNTPALLAVCDGDVDCDGERSNGGRQRATVGIRRIFTKLRSFQRRPPTSPKFGGPRVQ
eukprot:gene12057-biopygen382